MLDIVRVTWNQVAQTVVIELGRVRVARVVQGHGAVNQRVVGTKDVQGRDVYDGSALVGQLGGTLTILNGKRRGAGKEDGKLNFA